MALHDSQKRDQYETIPNPRTFKGRVVAEFVDAIPEVNNPTKGFKRTTIFAAQDGVKEALEKAMHHPKKAMLLVKYDEGAPSRRRTLAELRELAMKRQGYNESNGWVVRAVEGEVYVMWTGASL